MSTVTPVLWKSKKTKHGEHPVYVRIEAAGRRRYVSTRLYTVARHWNPNKSRIRKSHPLSDEMNAVIERQTNEIKRTILNLRLQGEDVTPTAVKEELKPPAPSRTNFIAYGNEYAEELRQRGKIPTSNRYRSIMRKLVRFAGENLPFFDVDKAFVRSYITHIVNDLGNAPSTVASDLRAMRSLYNRAISDGIVDQDSYPFDGITIKEPPSQKKKLTAAEIEALKDLDLESGSPQWHARNNFLFSMFCAGIRFRDMADLRIKHVLDGRLNYKMRKTGGNKNVDLPPVAQDILDHYIEDWGERDKRVFPLLDGYDTSTPEKFDRAVQSQNAYTNKLLKEIASAAGINPKLSFHMSRHSFASMALDAKWGVRKIQAALGHSDLQTTERYLKQFDPEFIGEEMSKLFQSADS